MPPLFGASTAWVIVRCWKCGRVSVLAPSDPLSALDEATLSRRARCGSASCRATWPHVFRYRKDGERDRSRDVMDG